MATAQEEFLELMRDKDRTRGHPEDDHDNDGESFLNLSDSDDDQRTPPASTIDVDDDHALRSPTQARHTIPLTRYEANTGPKGVIADAQNFRDSRRVHRMSIRGNANQPAVRPAQSDLMPATVDDDSDADDEGIDDHDFMHKWRINRLKEMQNGGKAHHQRKRSRVWGGLTTVDGNGYLDAVDNSPGDTVVVVYIFDDYSQVSVAIEECIRTLAQKHIDVRFIKLHFEDAEMEPAGVPALLAYRGGDKFAGLVPIIQEIPDDAELSASTLELVLKRHQILQ